MYVGHINQLQSGMLTQVRLALMEQMKKGNLRIHYSQFYQKWVVHCDAHYCFTWTLSLYVSLPKWWIKPMLLFQTTTLCGFPDSAGGQELSAPSAEVREVRMSGEWSRMDGWRARWSRISIWRGVSEILGDTRLAELAVGNSDHQAVFWTCFFLWSGVGFIPYIFCTQRPLLIWQHCNTHDGSSRMVYMLTWLGYINGKCYHKNGIHTDPMG